MLRVVVIFVVAITYSGCALGAKYCCYPPIWESLNFFRQGGLVNGTLVSSSGTEMTSVDTNISMVNSMASITTSGQTTAVRTIQDWGKGKQYVIIGGTCTVSNLPGPYPNKCVPDAARLDLPGIVMGMGKNQLSFDVFSITQDNVTVSFDIAKPDCIPMAVNSFGSMNGGMGMSSKLYTNFTLDIKDRSVFTIPSICNQAEFVPHQAKFVPHHQVHPRSVVGL